MKNILIFLSIAFTLQSCSKSFFELFMRDNQCASHDQRFKKKDHIRSDLKNHQ